MSEYSVKATVHKIYTESFLTRQTAKNKEKEEHQQLKGCKNAP